MLLGLHHLQLNGSSICVTLCDKILSTPMWTPEFLLCHYSVQVLSHGHHRVVIEHDVAIGVVVHCFERSGNLTFCFCMFS